MDHLMKPSDVGICGVETRLETLDFPEELRKLLQRAATEIKIPESTIVVTFQHEGSRRGSIDFTNESAGTKKLFHVAGDWWALATQPQTILADELGASLHPRLLDRLIRSINDRPPTDPPSQLIFTTHDTGLMEGIDGLPPALRRDQVYFTKKTPIGETELYSLTEFKDDARPVHNVRKRYLSGQYGAIPSLEKFAV